MTKPQEVGYGIVGTGMIAGVHAKAIAAVPGARLAAVYDAVRDRAEAFAREHGTQAEASLEALLGRADVHVVSIATPSGSRAETAVAAAQAGKHVLCEKPIEVTLERVDRIIDACRAHGVILAGVFQRRTCRNVQRLRAAIDAGRFGRLVLVDAHIPWFRDQAYYNSAPWRGTWALDGGGVLMNQGIHTLDLMLHLAGPPLAVQAYADRLTHDRIEVEDTAVATVRFACGALGTIAATTCCAPGFPARLSIHGERGSVVLEGDRLLRWTFAEPRPEDAVIRQEGGQSEGLAGGADNAGGIGPEGHRRQFADLTEAVRSGREPLIPGTEARRAVALIAGIYDSARSGKATMFA